MIEEWRVSSVFPEKYLISNLGWMISGILTANIPLIVSNALCLVVMAIELIRSKK